MKKPLAARAAFKPRRATVFAGWGALVGSVVLVAALAADSFMTTESEAGTVIGPATVLSDSSASGGQAVQFGSALGTCANPSPPVGIAVTTLKFCDSFPGTSLSANNWNPYITSKAANGFPWNDNHAGGSGEGCNFDAEHYTPSQLGVGNGALNLTALEQPVAGICSGTAHTFPWTSGTVSSYKHFETNGGYIQFTMKAPAGNGLWPALWMLPGPDANTTTDNFEIDIQEGGFLPAPSNQQVAWHLHQGTPQVGGTVNSGVDLTAGFHDYGLYWVPGQSIAWYFDGRQIAQVTSAQFAIPNEPMELIMELNVAGSNASGWHTVYDATTPSPSTMQVSNVQVWQ